MKRIVAKFGGTSMGTAEAIRQVAEIVESLGEGAVVVVSATSGTTDALIALGEKAAKRADLKNDFEALKEKHEKIIKGLEIESDLSPFFEEIKLLLEDIHAAEEFGGRMHDRLVSFGERISSNILAAYLKNGKAVDAYEMVFTDEIHKNAEVDFGKTNPAIVENLINMKGVIPVITGFLGQSPARHYTTLGRGGSDYTGAIVAAAIEADELQIWTDVDGVFNANPKVIPEASALPKISFNEASELAYFGAKVLHPKTIQPAIKKGIPVKVLNTFNPSAPGTLIDNEESDSIKSISSKKGISVINVCSSGMLNAHGFIAKIFEVFARNRVAVDVVATSEVSVSISVDQKIPKEVIEELEIFSTVKVDEKMAIVCLVGEGIKTNKNVLGDMFSAIAGFSVGMVSQGASQRNITFIVKEDDADEIVKILFRRFFKK